MGRGQLTPTETAAGRSTPSHSHLPTPLALTSPPLWLLSLAALISCSGLEPEGSRAAPDARLHLLRERSDYAALDQEEVTALALAAERHWPARFAGFEALRVERFSSGPVAHWMAVWTHRASGLEFVLVPGGTFLMGSPPEEPGRSEDERQHWVTLDPFLLARTECTQGAWARLAEGAGLDASPSYYAGEERRPVESVNPEDIRPWLDAAGLDLPTEAQWEFAARSGVDGPWAIGGDARDLRRVANLGSAECPEDWVRMGLTEPWEDGFGDLPSPASSFAPNAFGLFDMHGNVMEYCRDFYHGYAVEPDPGTGMRPGASADRMVRGGNFRSPASGARSAHRLPVGPGPRNRDVGFRPGLDLPFPVDLEGWIPESLAPRGSGPTPSSSGSTSPSRARDACTRSVSAFGPSRWGIGPGGS